MQDYPEPFNVPPLMRDGETAESWVAERRGQIRELLERECYGFRPVERPPKLEFDILPSAPDSGLGPDADILDGKAFRRRVRVRYGGDFGEGSFTFTACIPHGGKPSPAFVFIALHPLEQYIGPLRTDKSIWDVEQMLGRGYAAIGFNIHEVSPDIVHGNTRGAFAAFSDVEQLYRPRDEWGALSLWAWAASRILDWIETVPELIDPRRVAVIGHSRGGKTALLAGALDSRFAMVCSNDSGAGGAKLNHVDLPDSEHVMNLVRARQFWFSLDFTKWVNRDFDVPWDQHMLVALSAPRPVCIASATEDAWAGPWGEWCTARLASPAWELLGRQGLVADSFPDPDTAQQDGWISYHLRAGGHGLLPSDWTRYLDFADKRMK